MELFFHSFFDASKLCIILNKEEDACVGDSGGPLICDSVQYGITSFGLGCAQLGMPAVFTNVSAFHDWIYGVLNNRETLVISRMVEVANLTKHLLQEKSLFERLAKNDQTSLKCFVGCFYSLIFFILIIIK